MSTISFLCAFGQLHIMFSCLHIKLLASVLSNLGQQMGRWLPLKTNKKTVRRTAVFFGHIQTKTVLDKYQFHFSLTRQERAHPHWRVSHRTILKWQCIMSSSPVARWDQLEQISEKTTSRREKQTAVNSWKQSVKSHPTMNSFNRSYFLHTHF